MGATWAARGLPVEEERAASCSRAGESRHKGRARDTGQRPDGDTAGDGGPGPHPRSMGTPGHGPAAVRLRGVPSSCHRALPPGGPRGLHGVLTRLRATGSTHVVSGNEASFPQQLFNEAAKRSKLCGDPGPSHCPPCKQRNAEWNPPLRATVWTARHHPSIRHFYFQAASDPSWTNLSHWPVHFRPHRQWIWHARCLFQLHN